MGDDGIKVMGETFAGKAWRTPDGSDCNHAANLRKIGEVSRWMHHYYLTIEALMLAGFCLLIACRPAIGEDIFRPTGRYAEQEPCVESSQESSGSYLVCFSASWCSPCQAWKRSERSKIEAAGHTVTVVETDHAKWGVERIPQFWIVDRATSKPTEKITGYTGAETLIAKLGIVDTPQIAARVRNVSGDSVENSGAQSQVVVGDAAGPLSHSEMVALHNSLHGGGQWTWPGDLETHLATAHGVNTARPASQPVRIQQSSYCPTGNCPTNRTKRRGGFLMGLFR